MFRGEMSHWSAISVKRARLMFGLCSAMYIPTTLLRSYSWPYGRTVCLHLVDTRHIFLVVIVISATRKCLYVETSAPKR